MDSQMMAEQRKQRRINRQIFIDEILRLTRPDLTGTFSFDMFRWKGKWKVDGSSQLRMFGDHGTSNFYVSFGKTTITIQIVTNNPGDNDLMTDAYYVLASRTIRVSYGRNQKEDICRIASEVVTTMLLMEKELKSHRGIN